MSFTSRAIFSATLAMWAKRFQRIISAWDDPSNTKKSGPWLTGAMVFKLLCGALLMFYSAMIYRAMNGHPFAQSTEVFATFLFFILVTYLLNRLIVAAKYDGDDRFTMVLIFGLVGTMIGTLATALIHEKIYEKRIVTASDYAHFLMLAPDCARYEDYRRDRLEKNKILIIHDLRMAKYDCKAQHELTTILKQQQKLR